MNRYEFGDIKVFEVVFNDYYSKLVAYAQTILKNTDEAEDIVQHVFISIWEKRSQIEIRTSIRSLLYKSVYNASLNRVKQIQTKQRYSTEYTLNRDKVSTQTNLEESELQKKLADALTVLPEQCAKIFKMSRFEELKYKEIADKLGISVKTVENQMGKALKIMREQLKEYLSLLLIILLSNK